LYLILKREARAGIVQIAQYALEFNSGKIKSLDFDGKIISEGGQAVHNSRISYK
jgi:hypothetical protein